jgi:hypothetical protein
MLRRGAAISVKARCYLASAQCSPVIFVILLKVEASGPPGFGRRRAAVQDVQLDELPTQGETNPVPSCFVALTPT